MTSPLATSRTLTVTDNRSRLQKDAADAGCYVCADINATFYSHEIHTGVWIVVCDADIPSHRTWSGTVHEQMKLGFEFATKDQANRMIHKIQTKGMINPEHWN